MAKNKTVETTNSVSAYLQAIPDEKKRRDCTALVEIFAGQTGFEPKMWGDSIVGFGSYHYRYESGHEGDAPLTGLSSRKNAIVLYLGTGFDQKEELLKKFGKHKEGKGCIYIQKLEDIDPDILARLVRNSVAWHKKKYAC